jgi:putative spermidine/putrescine transport system ATP-binding protein
MVNAELVDAGGVGSRATLSIRPERVELLKEDSSMPNTVSGRIEELIYLGDHVRIRMTVAGTDEFIVKIRNSADRKVLRKGDEMTVGWRSQDCRALEPLSA